MPIQMLSTVVLLLELTQSIRQKEDEIKDIIIKYNSQINELKQGGTSLNYDINALHEKVPIFKSYLSRKPGAAI
jgi:hypothetical protein